MRAELERCAAAIVAAAATAPWRDLLLVLLPKLPRLLLCRLPGSTAGVRAGAGAARSLAAHAMTILLLMAWRRSRSLLRARCMPCLTSQRAGACQADRCTKAELWSLLQPLLLVVMPLLHPLAIVPLQAGADAIKQQVHGCHQPLALRPAGQHIPSGARWEGRQPRAVTTGDAARGEGRLLLQKARPSAVLACLNSHSTNIQTHRAHVRTQVHVCSIHLCATAHLMRSSERCLSWSTHTCASAPSRGSISC